MNIKISITLACVVFASSCHDKFLEEEPYSFLTNENFYKNAKDAQSAVNAVYRSLYENNNDYYGYNLLALAEFPTNTVTSALHTANVDHGRLDVWSPVIGDEGSIYGATFKIVNRANSVLDNVPQIQMDEELKARILAEAKFLRALVYFNAVRIYGQVPLITSATREEDLGDLEADEASEADIYEQVIKDLMEAKEVLPSVKTYGAIDKGRAGRSASKTLLAKVYLTRGTEPELQQAGDLQNAVDLLREVVSDADHNLEASYADLWNYETNENNEEIIFDIQLTRIEGFGGRLTRQVATTNTGSIFANSFGTMSVEIDFYNSYEPGDLRRDVTFDNSFVKGGQTVMYDPANPSTFPQDTPGFKKHVDFNKAARLGQEEPNFVVLRYADVLLMLAEALNELNGGPGAEAYEALNQIRRRAHGLNVNTPDPSVDIAGMDYQGFREVLFEERQKELVLEGHGWFDGLRFYDLFTRKVAESSIGADPSRSFRPKQVIDFNRIQDPKFRHFPIPSDAIERNSKLNQPAGWE